MKHILIIGALIVAAAAGYLALNKGRLTDATRAAIIQVGAAHDTIPIDRGVATIPPIIAQPAGSNAVTMTNAAQSPAATNTWERVTAGRYADLIKEIRNARGNAQ